MDPEQVEQILLTGMFNRLLAYLAGALLPVGIHFAYTDQTSAALATLTLAVGLGIWHWVKSKANLKKAIDAPSPDKTPAPIILPSPVTNKPADPTTAKPIPK